jgi:hypothetical protein
MKKPSRSDPAVSPSDAELERALGAAWEGDGALASRDLDGMLSSVESEIDRSRSSALCWLRSRPTIVRRALMLGSTALLLAATGFGILSEAVAKAPARVAIALVAMSVLLLISMVLAVRPLHRPMPSRAVTLGMAGLTIAATFLLSALPVGEPIAPGGDAGGAAPCMYFGLMIGVPVYALARVLDRGSELTAIMAACAAGLAGNVVLQLHCPLASPAHMLFGHFSVVVVFVAGLALVRLAEHVLRK